MAEQASQRAAARAEAIPLAWWLSAGLVVASLAAVNPWGWDRFGPIRWMLLPSLLFAAMALTINSGSSPIEGAYARTTRRTQIIWAAFLALAAVAAWQGADPLHAWIGTPDRHLGWVTWLLFALAFLLGGWLTSSHSAAGAFLARAVAVGITLCGVYTVAEWLDIAVDVSFADGRLGGPFGQPAYLGAAAALGLPVAAGLAADESQPLPWRWVGAAGSLGGGLALLTSQTRAAWVGVGVALLLLIVQQRRQIFRFARSQWWVVPGVVAAGAIVAIVTPVGRRAASLFESDGVLRGRTDEWQVALRAIGDAPVLGHGPEGYRTVFGRHVDTGYVLAHGRDTITDRAHSGPLDVAVTVGIPAALLYLALVVGVLVGAWRLIGRASPSHIGLGVGLVAFAIQRLFLFPVAELDIIFWLLAGTATAIVGAEHVGDRVRRAETFSATRTIAAGLCGGLALVTLVAGGMELVADGRVRDAVDATDPAEAEQKAVAASDLRPDSTRYLFISSRLATSTDFALSQVQRGLDRSPSDPAFREEQTSLLLDRARGLPPGADRNAALLEAVAAFETLIDDDPRHPLHHRRLGVAHALLGDFAEARNSLNRAASLNPNDPGIAQDLAEVDRLAQGEEL